MSTVGTAYVQIVPSAQGISGSISKVLGGEANAAGSSAGASIVSKIKGAIVASGIAAALTKTIQEGARYEQAVGGIETMFGEYSDQMVKYANEAYKAAGLSANDYMEQVTSFSASLLQSTGGDTKKAGEAANQAINDMSDNANKFGTDITSIQNAYQGFAKQNYTMLDNLKLGYGGTKTEMERLLTDAQKISGQKYDISNLNDVYEAIHVVQEEMGVAGTTSKEAATTLSGSFASMKAAASNFLAQLTTGGDVEGALGDMVNSAVTFLTKNLIPAIGRIIKALPKVAIRFIGTTLPNLINKLTSYLSKLLDGKAPGTAASFFGKLLVASAKATGKLVLAILKMLGTLVPKLIKQIPTMIKNLATSIWSSLKKVAPGLTSVLTTAFTTAWNVIKAVWNGVSGFFKGIWTAIKAVFNGVVTYYKTIFTTAWNVVKAVWNKASGFFKGIWNGIKNIFGAVGSFFRDKFSGGLKAIKGAFGNVKNFFSGIWKGIKNVFGSVGSWFKGKFSAAWGAIKNAFSGFGKFFSGLWGKIKDTFKGLGSKIGGAIGGAVKKAINAVIEFIEKRINGAIDLINGAIKVINKIIPGKSLDVGKVKHVKFPRLASGGVLEKGQVGLLEGSGAEAVVPLEKNRQWINKVAAQFRAGMPAQSDNGNIVVNLNYDASEDSKDMLRDLARGIRRYKMAGAI